MTELAWMYVCFSVCVCERVWGSEHGCTCVRMFVFVYVREFLCGCVCVCVCVCVCMCVYGWVGVWVCVCAYVSYTYNIMCVRVDMMYVTIGLHGVEQIVVRQTNIQHNIHDYPNNIKDTSFTIAVAPFKSTLASALVAEAAFQTYTPISAWTICACIVDYSMNTY